MDDFFQTFRKFDALFRNPYSELLREQQRQREILAGIGRNSALEAARSAALVSARTLDLPESIGSFAEAAEAALGRAGLAHEAIRSLRPNLELGHALEAARLGAQAATQARSILEEQSLALGEGLRAAANWGATVQAHLGEFKRFAPLADQFYAELGRLSDLSSLRTHFGGELLAALSGVAEATGEEEIVEAWNTAADWYVAETKARTKGSIHFLTFFSIFLTLLIFLYQRQTSAESEARILARVSQTEERLLDALHGLAPERPQSSVVLALRNLRLRARPTSSSKSLKSIVPNTPLEVIAVQGDWLRVRVFDVKSGEALVGWVFRRFVARVSFEP